jgi:hypothetical protein
VGTGFPAIKKKWVAYPATHFFLAALKVPPDLPQAKLLSGVNDAARDEICASRYGMRGYFVPPSQSPDWLSHEQKGMPAAGVLPQKNESLRTDSIEMWCFGYNKKRT